MTDFGSGISPVQDWATDYDILDPEYIKDPVPVWTSLREQCPIARTERRQASWLPVDYDDVRDFAADTDLFSSADPIVISNPSPDAPPPNAPPITSDPPEHFEARRLILPAFSPKATAAHEPYTRDLCRRLLDGFRGHGRVDAAADYAQQIPPRVIAHLLGVNEERSADFTHWVRCALELGMSDPPLRDWAREQIFGFFSEEVAARRAQPGSDFISEMITAEIDGAPITDHQLVGTCNLLLVAGIDTTWSSIGSAIWHLATHSHDRRRLVEEPDLISVAVEELLRAYSPVTMARLVTRDEDFKGCPMKAGDTIIMNFPAANRDPKVFPEPDQVIIDRAENRHVAFGVGIHRCAGSNLARMEMKVAIEEWLKAIPEFALDEPEEVIWAGGQVRGPRQLKVTF